MYVGYYDEYQRYGDESSESECEHCAEENVHFRDERYRVAKVLKRIGYSIVVFVIILFGNPCCCLVTLISWEYVIRYSCMAFALCLFL